MVTVEVKPPEALAIYVVDGAIVTERTSSPSAIVSGTPVTVTHSGGVAIVLPTGNITDVAEVTISVGSVGSEKSPSVSHSLCENINNWHKIG